MSYAGGFPAKKNVEFLLIFPIYDNTGALVSGAADLDSEISKDGGGFIDCTNEASEIGSSGIYKLTLTLDEMNADVVSVITKTSTENAKTTASIIYTSANQIEAMRGTDNAATETKQDIIDGIVDNIKSYLVEAGRIDALLDTIIAKTDNLPADPASETKQDIIDGIVDDIKADLVDGGRLDLLIDAIKARTDINATEAKQDIIDAIVDDIKSYLVDGGRIDLLIDTIDGIVDAIKAKTDTLGGAGAITWVYTLTDSETGDPISEADVWITTDEAGTNVIASGKTDQYGKVTFYLDAGTVYVFRQCSGYDFINPDVEVVS